VTQVNALKPLFPELFGNIVSFFPDLSTQSPDSAFVLPHKKVCLHLVSTIKVVMFLDRPACI